MTDAARGRGFTLVEMMVVLAVLAIVSAAVMQAISASYRAQRSRETQTRVQGESRQGLSRMEEDLRAGALGASTGVIWGDAVGPDLAIDPNPVAKRPAVQIFDNVPGGGKIVQVKPGTDVILVVAAMRGASDDVPEMLVSQQTYYDATAPLSVSEVEPLAAGARFVLVGARDAVFAGVSSVTGSKGPGQLKLDLLNPGVFPNGKMDAGSRVRVASAHLYYVDTSERLVRASLAAPRPPLAPGEIFDLTVLADGIENLQVDCETDGGLGTLAGCPGVIPSNPLNRLVEEARAAGLADDTVGPRITEVNVASLRMIQVAIVARSLQPVLDEAGDPPIAIMNQAALLPIVEADKAKPFRRRLYRMSVGVRNTSLGTF